MLKDFQLPWTEEATQDVRRYDLDYLMIPPWGLQVRSKERGACELRLEMHHCLYDAEAMTLLLAEVESSYQGCQLSPPASFDHYLSFMEASNIDDTYQFWCDQLESVPLHKLSELILPEDKVASGTSILVEHEASLQVSEFHECVRRASATPLALFQAAWARLLCCIFESSDVCFGNVLSGRNLPINGVDRMVAPCFNTIPMRAQLRRDRSNQNLCHDLQQMNGEVLSYQSSSLRCIQRKSATGGRALFDTLLLLQQEGMKLNPKIWTLIEESGDMSFPFILEVVMDTKADSISLRLHSEICKKGILAQLLESFDTLLVHTAKYPQAGALDYSSAASILPRLLPCKDVVVCGQASHINGATHPDEELSRTETIVKDIMVQLKPDIVQKIARSTTIFHLGFDSINAVQIAARLRKQGFKVSTGDILDAASLSKIATLCDSSTKESHDQKHFDLDQYDGGHRQSICQSINIDEARVQAIWPCTPTQSGIISQFLRSGGKIYFNHMHFKCDADVDLSRLKHAWSAAMEKHEMLRTGFAEVDDPKTPFAMIIYQPNAAPLPWFENVIDNFDDVRDLRQPWHLRVSKPGPYSTLELSILHALYDAYSLDIILDDVANFYRTVQPPKAVALAPVVSRMLAVSRDESSKTFWSELSTDICSTQFPDMRIFNTGSEKYCVTTLQCGVSCTTLEKACADIGASMQALVAAAWAVVLSAYTAQDHVTFGIILSGRDFDEDENEVAFPCINTVPFAVEVSPDKNELMRQATRRCAGILKHQHTPLNTIKRWAQVEGELFDTVIVLQKYTSGQGPKRPWTMIKDDATAEYTVSLEVLPQENDKVDLQLICRDSVVPPGQASIILREYEAVMRSIIARGEENSKLPESLLSIVPAKEQRIPTDVRYLHELVELTAHQKPNNIALEFVSSLQGTTPMKQTWTYSQLDSNGNRIARLIQSKEAKVGELVAVCFDKCPEASFAILGTLKAGCGYIAIDPGAPASRKEFILNDSGCKVVLTTEDKLSDFTSVSNVTVLPMNNGSWQRQPAEKLSLDRPLNMQDTCYCLYTSGTTGTPKGCLISHDSAVQAMLSFQRIFRGRWNDSSRWLQFASFHFDVSVLEQYWSWSVGICVTSAPRDLLFEDLPGTINALKITHLDLTPSLARLLTPEDVPSLCEGVFIVGGEQVRQDILDIWGGTGCLYNFYGPSEVTIGCTVHPQVPKHTKSTNIGQQWDNVGSFVLEPDTQKPVLRGTVGELCLSGPLVGKGYLNRPELTAEKFVTLNEFNTEVYRTGDLVRLLHDNSFEFLGRIDDQVKLRGQRLEIGEINHIAVSADSSIRDVATMVLKHPTQQKDNVVTFFTTAQRRSRNDQPLIVSDNVNQNTASKIRKHCSDKLPTYMVPTYVIAVSSLPLSANNKVDHKTLRELYESGSIKPASGTCGAEAEATDGGVHLDTEMVETLASFLQIPALTIKPTSRLFELGLDSISAIGLSRAFKRRGYRNADVAIILRHAVVQDLARVIAQGTTSDSTQAVDAARVRVQSFADKHRTTVSRSLKVGLPHMEHIAPCTPLQEGMISKVMRGGSNDTVYFSCFRFELNPDTNVARLKEAWNAAQQSISVLRTFFISTEDGYAQVVLRKCMSGVRITTLERECKDIDKAQDLSFNDWVRDVRSLGTSLPWKVELATSETGGVMALYIFHGLYDGSSLPLLLEIVKRHYDHPEEALPPPMQFYEALPYGPLCQLPNDTGFWSSRFSSFRALRLPMAHREHESSNNVITLKNNVVLDSLQNLCKKLNVTTSAFFQSLLLYALHKQFRASPTIGVVVSGRATSHEGLENVIGPIFNTIPCAINSLEKGATVADLVQACHEFNLETIPYQHTPLRKIAQYLGQDISKGLFDTLFVFQKVSNGAEDGALWYEILTESSPEYPLNVEVEQDGMAFNITIVSKPAYVDKNDAKQLLNVYLEMIRDPGLMNAMLAEDLCMTTASTISNGVPGNNESKSGSIPNREDPLNDTEAAIRTETAKLASVREGTICRTRPTIFELGLDSIEAMKLVARLKNVGLRVAVSAVLKAPTVAGIAQAVISNADSKAETNGNSQKTHPLVDIQSSYRSALLDQGINLADVADVLPVTPMQEGLLLEADKYLNVMTFKLEPGTKLKRLAEAWEIVSRTEPVLRSRFTTVEPADGNTTFVQYVLRKADPVTVIYDRKLKDISTSFGAPMEQDLRIQRVEVVLVNEEMASFLVLAMPHSLYDAWSLNLLHQEVARVYQSSSVDIQDNAALPHRKHLEGVIYQSKSREAHKFWEDKLTNARPTIFEAELTNGNQPCRAFLLHEKSKTNLTEALKLCRHQGITLQSLGLACWTIALAHYTRHLDVCFGLVLSGRTMEGADRLIFPTFNTVVFRPRLDPDSTNAHALKQVHDAVVQVSEYQHFSLRDALQIARSQGIEEQLFNTLFTFQKLSSAGDDLPVLYEELPADERSIKPPYPVNVELEGDTNDLSWTVAFQEGIADEVFGHALLSKLDTVLSSLIDGPDQILLRKKSEKMSICGLPGVQLVTGDRTETREYRQSDRHEQSPQGQEILTPTETSIRDVLANVAKVEKEQIKKNTGIFHLGLDSISAIRVTSLLRKKGVGLPVSAIIREQTVEKIAMAAEESKMRIRHSERGTTAVVDDHSASNAVRKTLTIPQDDIETVILATAGQTYMLDLWTASNERLFYPTFRLKVQGTSLDNFKQALKKLFDQVPMLRTLFVSHCDEETPTLWQVVLKNRAVKQYDLPWAISVDEKDDSLLVTLRIHHALYDAVSFRHLLFELERLCSDNNSETRLNTDITTFISRTKETGRATQHFWTRYLREAQTPTLRGSFAAKRVERFNPRLIPIDKLNEQLRHYGLSIQALFFAVYARVYSSICLQSVHGGSEFSSQAQNTVVGIYLANRSLDIDGLTELAAPTFNIVPLRVQLGQNTLRETALQVQQDLAEITKLENCGVSMKEIYDWSGLKVNTYVNFLSLPSSNEPEDSSRIHDSDRVRVTHAKFDLEEKARTQELNVPSPFFQDSEVRDTTKWCMVSPPFICGTPIT